MDPLSLEKRMLLNRNCDSLAKERFATAGRKGIFRSDFVLKEIERLQEKFSLTEKQMEQFNQYYEMLIETNKVMNLTAITKKEEVYIKHFYDSLTVLQAVDIPKNSAIIDVGSGAGFPGIPLKIALPSCKLTLLDSLQKRVRFLDQVKNDCQLDWVQTVHARAEDGARKKELREQFDFVTARAVARLNVLVEYLLPYLRVGGYCVAMKGPGAQEELEEAKVAIERLGGKLKEMKKCELPFGMGERYLIILEKKKGTPKRYPRKAGIPNKEPIS